MRCNPLLIVWHTWHFHSGLNNFFISRISFPGLHDSFGWRELRSRIIQMQTIYGNMDEFHITREERRQGRLDPVQARLQLDRAALSQGGGLKCPRSSPGQS